MVIQNDSPSRSHQYLTLQSTPEVILYLYFYQADNCSYCSNNYSSKWQKTAATALSFVLHQGWENRARRCSSTPPGKKFYYTQKPAEFLSDHRSKSASGRQLKLFSSALQQMTFLNIQLRGSVGKQPHSSSQFGQVLNSMPSPNAHTNSSVHAASWVHEIFQMDTVSLLLQTQSQRLSQ